LISKVLSGAFIAYVYTKPGRNKFTATNQWIAEQTGCRREWLPARLHCRGFVAAADDGNRDQHYREHFGDHAKGGLR
jgi:hypothetical protein